MNVTLVTIGIVFLAATAIGGGLKARGGAGFLGSHLCERLLFEGYSVLCLDDFSTGSLANVAHLTEAGPFRLKAYGDAQVHPQPESYWGHVNPAGPRGVYDEAKRFAEAMTMGRNPRAM